MSGWEQALLGTVLADPASIASIRVVPSDFSYPSHQQIWEHMLALSRTNSLEYRSLVERMHGLGEIGEDKVPESYLRDLLGRAGTQVETYAREVVSASVKREVRQIAGLILLDAEDGNKSADEVLDRAETMLLELRREDIGDGQHHSIGELVAILTDRIDRQAKGEEIAVWKPSIVAVANIVDYFEQSDFPIIAARPGCGKSAVLRQELLQMALQGRPVLLINMENSHIEIARWIVASVTGINTAILKNGRNLSERDYTLYTAALDRLTSLPLYVETMPVSSVVDIDRAVRKNIHKHGIQAVAVDYVQLMDNGMENQVANVSVSSKGLRGIAQRYHIPVMAASQLSRAIETRGENATPKLSDLRESGSLEQDATQVIFIRDFWDNPSKELLSTIEENVNPRTGRVYDQIRALPVCFHVAKNRNGPVGISAPVLWNRTTGNFTQFMEAN